jgi:ribonuclease HI
MELNLYTDGGSRDNGGPAAIAWIIENATGQILDDGVEVIGPATNNRAEYRALLSGLKACQYFRPARVRCYSDSELMVKQLNGDYRVKNADLKALGEAVRELAAGLDISYRHVPREHPRIQQVDRALRAARDAYLNPLTP